MAHAFGRLYFCLAIRRLLFHRRGRLRPSDGCFVTQVLSVMVARIHATGPCSPACGEHGGSPVAVTRSEERRKDGLKPRAALPTPDAALCCGLLLADFRQQNLVVWCSGQDAPCTHAPYHYLCHHHLLVMGRACIRVYSAVDGCSGSPFRHERAVTSATLPLLNSMVLFNFPPLAPCALNAALSLRCYRPLFRALWPLTCSFGLAATCTRFREDGSIPPLRTCPTQHFLAHVCSCCV